MTPADVVLIACRIKIEYSEGLVRRAERCIARNKMASEAALILIENNEREIARAPAAIARAREILKRR